MEQAWLNDKTKGVGNGSYVCPDVRKKNPFAVKAFVDRIQVRAVRESR
jgi:hypothetical protein